MDYSGDPNYLNRARILKRSNKTVLGELFFIPKVLRAAGDTGLLLLDSTSGRIHPDLLATIVIGFRPKSRRPVIVFMGAMWQKDPGLYGFAEKILIKLADRAIYRYAVQSTDEIPYFFTAWGIPESKLRFVPYFSTFTESDLSTPAPTLEKFIFSGGNSHRDYDPYLKAIESLPEHQFVIASHLLDGKKLPPNVRAGQVTRPEFIRLMRASAAVVVPLRRDLNRAVGQQTYLNAMLLGKPTIVTNTLGVRDHIKDGVTALVVDGSPEGYIEAIQKVFNPSQASEIEHLCQRAHQDVIDHFSFENHVTRLLEILDEVIQENQLLLKEFTHHVE